MFHENIELGTFIQSLLTVNSPLKEDDLRLRKVMERTPSILRKKDTYGNTPIHIYVGSSIVDVKFLDRLMQFDTDIVTLPGRFGRLPLHYALCRNRGDPQIIKYLLSINPNGASIRTNGGWIPLHYAVDRNETCLEVVKTLCEHYPDGPFVKDFDGKVALHWAIDRQYPINLEVVRHLVKLNSSAIYLQASDRIHIHGNLITSEWTPMQKSLELGHTEIARIFMFATPQVRDKNLFFELNWIARRVIIMSVAHCSATSTVQSPGKRKRVDTKAAFLRLYQNHFSDLWRVVMSYI